MTARSSRSIIHIIIAEEEVHLAKLNNAFLLLKLRVKNLLIDYHTKCIIHYILPIQSHIVLFNNTYPSKRCRRLKIW